MALTSLNEDWVIEGAWPLKNIVPMLAQPENAEYPILVTLSGILMLVKPVQLQNASSPILVTPFGMLMFVRLLQLRNACIPMLVMFSGRRMLVRPVH